MADSPDPRKIPPPQEGREALDEQYAREWHPIYGLIYRAVRHAQEAQDLTQEVFLRAAPKWGQAARGSFHAYLVVIARNLLRDRWKRRRLPLVGLDEAGVLAAPAGDAAEQFSRDIAPAQLWPAFLALPEDYRRVLRLRIVGGRSTPEVAAILGRSPDAVRQLQHRAVVALRHRLQQEDQP